MAWWIFQQMVATAGLALVAAMVCRATRIGPVARHALWVIVLVKFVTPPLFVWPWAAPDPLGVARLHLGAGAPNGAGGQDEWNGVGAPADDAATLSMATVAAGADEGHNRTQARAAAAWAWLVGLWLAGSLGLLAVEAVRLVRFARRVRAAHAADPAIEDRVARLSSQIGLRSVPVVTIPGCSAPVIWCLGRPRLLWPADLAAGATAASIDGLIVHELAHVTRRDHLVGWIELLAGVIWWWNPLFWLVRSARREQAELACDAWVISALPDGRRAYAESLLALSGATACDAPAVSLAVVGVRASSRRVLERRLVMIMKGRASLRLPLAGLVALAVAAAATLPAWATGQQPSPVPPAPAVVPAAPQPPGPAVPVRTVLTPELRQLPPPPPPPLPKAVKKKSDTVAAAKVIKYRIVLPEDGQKLVQGFETERDAIQKEADQQIEARREAVVKALQDLQNEYAKAGRLDEAAAIRNYLKAGLPGLTFMKVTGEKGQYILRQEKSIP
jgi:beta-lactamase regulating signal transducer with metallopeptidase domain